jgi:hypothetical protein
MTNPTGGYQPPSTTTTYDDEPSTTDTAKSEAANVGQTAKDAGGQVATTAAEQAKNVAGETKRQAQDLINQAQSQVQEQAGAQKDKAATGLRSLADELRSMAEGNAPQNGMTSDLVRQASDKAHELASWIDQRDPGSLLDEVRQLARRKPGTFLLGAALAGVVAGRLTRGVVAANSSDSAPSAAAHYGGTPSSYGTSQGTTGAYGTTTAAYGTPTTETGPLVIEQEFQPAHQTVTGSGLGMEEDRR